MLDSLLYVFDGLVIKDFGKITKKDEDVEFETLHPIITLVVMPFLVGLGVYFAAPWIRDRMSQVKEYIATKRKERKRYKVTEKGIIDVRNWPEFLNAKNEALYEALAQCEPMSLQEEPISLPVSGALSFDKFCEIHKIEEIDARKLANIPSMDLYPEATDKLWIIRTTFSEALRKRGSGLSKICEALRKNPNLEVHIATAEFEDRLYHIAREEVEGIYSSDGDAAQLTPEQIQRFMITNKFDKSIQKFLYPPTLDYMRKLNDMYAAFLYLHKMAKEEGFERRIKCHTYKGPPTLRSTLIYGRKEKLDFIHTYEGHIGMTGTLFRLEGRDHNKALLWERAEEERKKVMGIEEDGMDLFETIEELIRVFQFRLDDEVREFVGVSGDYFEPDKLNEGFLVQEWVNFDNRIQKFCNERGYGIGQEEKNESRRKRREFLNRVNNIITNRAEGTFREVIACRNADPLK